MQIGLIVHPTRPIDRVLDRIRAWASAHGATVGQVPVQREVRQMAEPVDAAACDLLLSLGGDGTTLLALHTGAAAGRPVLGVACGSVGVLTSVAGDRVDWALDEVAAGRWTQAPVPGLEVAAGEGEPAVAINDVAVIRAGAGQVIVGVTVDEVLYARVAGDGLVVATALGSSAYTLAAGGPIFAPGAQGMVVTPLASHGGSCPPLVAGPDTRLTLAIDPGYGGVRFEIDGRPLPVEGRLLTVTRRPHYATVVTLFEEEPRLTGLRRRGLVLDSPRAIVRQGRVEPTA